jgi:hypothetical protein
MQENVMELADLFPLPPDLEEKFRPEALQLYNEWRIQILKDIPALSQLSKEEAQAAIHKYLIDPEKESFQKYANEMAEWLWYCTQNQNVPFSILRPMVYLPTREIAQLLRQAFDRKAKEIDEQRRAQEAKAAEEEEEKDMRLKIKAATKALNPPIEKAERYLDKNEYQKFHDSAARALLSYATHGEEYIHDPQSLAYLRWVKEINARQNAEEQKKVAEEKAKQYNRAFNKELRRLKAELLKDKQDTESYLRAHAGDRRYLPYSFAFKSSAQEEQRRDAIVERKVAEIVHPQFIKFITNRHRTRYFLVPFARFRAEDVFLLNFYFKVYAVVEIEVWMEPGEGNIEGYVFTFPWIEEKTDYGPYLREVRTPELVGYEYLLLTPSDLGHYFWRSLPLVLVKGLMAGELEPVGTSIMELSENFTTYSVNGLDDEVVIPERFADYLKELGGIEAMVAAGVIGDKVASVIKKCLERPLALPSLPALPVGDALGFEKDEFISALTGLGIPRKDAEQLLALTPKDLPLPEAVRLALQNYKDQMSHKGDNEIT